MKQAYIKIVFEQDTLNVAPNFEIPAQCGMWTNHSILTKVMFIFRFHLSFVSYLESPGDNPFVPQTNLILQLFPAIRNIYQQQIGSLIQKKLHSHPNCLIYHDIRKIFSSSDKCTKVPCRCSRGINNIFQYCKKKYI